jgi:hypothetical protein
MAQSTRGGVSFFGGLLKYTIPYYLAITIAISSGFVIGRGRLVWFSVRHGNFSKR